MSDTNDRRTCEFQLLRYVPDAVRNEYVHIGVILREQGSRKPHWFALLATGGGCAVLIQRRTQRCWRAWKANCAGDSRPSRMET